MLPPIQVSLSKHKSPLTTTNIFPKLRCEYRNSDRRPTRHEVHMNANSLGLIFLSNIRMNYSHFCVSVGKILEYTFRLSSTKSFPPDRPQVVGSNSRILRTVKLIGGQCNGECQQIDNWKSMLSQSQTKSLPACSLLQENTIC